MTIYYIGYVFLLAVMPVFLGLRLGWPAILICVLAEAAMILLIFYWAANWEPWPPSGRKAHELVGYDLAYLIWLYIPGLAAFAGALAAAIWLLAFGARGRAFGR
jgi:hypothetical protein